MRQWIEAVHAGYSLLREGGQELAQDGVAFVDATGVFRDVTERLYKDACHFNRAGQERLGEFLAAEFLAHQD